ncbi:MAG: TIGR04076 family protein [Candidatus Heimdallarchaeota archaeon]|nr:TIGR04076 family protein [Candidatus Heimdallarchaeota archaeon]
MDKIKISVIKKFSPKDVVGHDLFAPCSGQIVTICSIFEEGQEFLVEGLKKPQNFCGWAWHDLYKDLLVLAFGGEHSWTEPNIMYTSCTDGKRPVCFKLERIET